MLSSKRFYSPISYVSVFERFSGTPLTLNLLSTDYYSKENFGHGKLLQI